MFICLSVRLYVFIFLSCIHPLCCFFLVSSFTLTILHVFHTPHYRYTFFPFFSVFIFHSFSSSSPFLFVILPCPFLRPLPLPFPSSSFAIYSSLLPFSLPSFHFSFIHPRTLFLQYLSYFLPFFVSFSMNTHFSKCAPHTQSQGSEQASLYSRKGRSRRQICI